MSQCTFYKPHKVKNERNVPRCLWSTCTVFSRKSAAVVLSFSTISMSPFLKKISNNLFWMKCNNSYPKTIATTTKPSLACRCSSFFPYISGAYSNKYGSQSFVAMPGITSTHATTIFCTYPSRHYCGSFRSSPHYARGIWKRLNHRSFWIWVWVKVGWGNNQEQ